MNGRGHALNRPSDAARIRVRVPDDADTAGRRHAGNQVLQTERVPRGWNRGDDVFGDDLLRPRALHVDNRRLTADRDRLLECTNSQVGIDGRDEVARQFDSFALDDAEPLQLEGHAVDTWPEIDDAVLPCRIGHDRPRFFNQGRTGSFNPYAR